MTESVMTMSSESEKELVEENSGLSVASGAVIEEKPMSLGQIFLRTAQRYPDTWAVISLDGAQDGAFLRLTYKQLQSAALVLVRKLRNEGISKGERIMTFLPNCAEYAIILWAAAFLGTPFVPLDTASITQPGLLKHYLSIIEPSVVIVHDASAAQTFDTHYDSRLRTLNSKFVLRENAPSWRLLRTVLENRSEHGEEDPEPDIDPNSDAALIVFTSGTTALPKACPVTGSSLSASAYSLTLLRRLTPDRSVLQHLPCNHIYAIYVMTTWWYVGGTVVIPSAKFNAKASLATLEQGLCTDVFLVPSMFASMISHPDYDIQKIKTVIAISAGGSLVPPSFVRKAAEAFNARYVTTAFGMSEGIPITSFGVNDTLPLDTDFVSVGKATPGVVIKVCKPGSLDVVPRGQHGELHVSGTTVIKTYLGLESDDFYSDEEGRRWFKTGDQVLMHGNDEITVLGRYKDVIIRGGENISPAVIEASLNKLNSVSQVQVVGIPDEFSGEVPVAIVPTQLEITSASVMQRHIQDELGPSHLISRFLSLEELGMKAFPLTISGKVKKQELRDVVKQYLEMDRYAKMDDMGSSSTRDALVELWSQVLAVPVKDVPLDLAIDKFADSLTLARVRVLIKRRLGKDVPEADLNSASGIQGQAKVLDLRSATVTSQEYERGDLHPRAPLMGEIPHVHEQEHRFFQTRDRVNAALAATGMTWDEDVEEVYPMPSNLVAILPRQRDFSYNVRTAMISRDTTMAHVLSSISRISDYWGITRTFLAQITTEETLYVQVRKESWVAHGITQHPHKVAGETALRRLCRKGLAEVLAQTPCAMFRIVLAEIEGSPDIGIIVIAHHCTFDAISMAAWQDDLRNTIHDPRYSQPRTPYKVWADMFYNGRTSVQAHTAAFFHVGRLTGVSNYPRPTFPQQRRQGPNQWYLGNDRGHGSPGNYVDHDDGDGGLDGISTVVPLPFLPELTRKHTIHAAMLLKTAFALYLTRERDIPFALFNTINAARKWPFVSPFIADRLPPTMEIAGPTFRSALDILAVNRDELALDMLRRVSEEQDALTQHIFAPRELVVPQLNAEDRAVMPDMFMRNVFNWLPQRLEQPPGVAKKLEVLQTDQHWNLGVMWNCQLQGPRSTSGHPTVLIRAHYDGAQVSGAEMEGHVQQVAKMAEWLCTPANWSLPVRNCYEQTTEVL